MELVTIDNLTGLQLLRANACIAYGGNGVDNPELGKFVFYLVDDAVVHSQVLFHGVSINGR
jgi:hypothetical protein